MPTDPNEAFRIRFEVVSKIMAKIRELTNGKGTLKDLDDFLFANQYALANGTVQRVRKPKDKAATLPLGKDDLK